MPYPGLREILSKKKNLDNIKSMMMSGPPAMEFNLDDGADLQSPEPKRLGPAEEIISLQDPDENQKLELVSPEQRNLNFNSEYKDRENNQMRSIQQSG
jgi:hypothetical protein